MSVYIEEIANELLRRIEEAKSGGLFKGELGVLFFSSSFDMIDYAPEIAHLGPRVHALTILEAADIVVEKVNVVFSYVVLNREKYEAWLEKKEVIHTSEAMNAWASEQIGGSVDEMVAEFAHYIPEVDPSMTILCPGCTSLIYFWEIIPTRSESEEASAALCPACAAEAIRSDMVEFDLEPWEGYFTDSIDELLWFLVKVARGNANDSDAPRAIN